VLQVRGIVRELLPPSRPPSGAPRAPGAQLRPRSLCPPPPPRQCTHLLSAAVAKGRAQGRAVHGVAVDWPPGELLAAGAAAATDLFTDPCGWLAPAATGEEGDGAPGAARQRGPVEQPGAAIASAGGWPASCLDRVAEVAGLVGQQQQAQQQEQHQKQEGQQQAWQQQPGEQGGRQHSEPLGSGPLCLAIDSLSTLMLRHSAARVGVDARACSRGCSNTGGDPCSTGASSRGAAARALGGAAAAAAAACAPTHRKSGPPC
jgi:hypothetical protein